MAAARKRILWGVLGAGFVVAGWLVVMIVSGVLEQRRLATPTPRPAPSKDAGAEAGGDDAGPDQADRASGPVFSLVGTVVASDPRWSRASILAAGERLLIRVGDHLSDGSRVLRILDDRVVLESAGGERWVLRLDERPAARKAAAADEPAVPPPEEPPEEPAGVERQAEGVYRLQRSAVEASLDEADSLLAQVRVSLVFDDRGGVSGLRLGLIGPGTIFERLGLQDGDVILRVAGLVVDSPQALSALPDLLRRAREVDVELERAGRTETLRYFIDPQ